MQGTTIPFVSQLRGTWHYQSDNLWVGFDTRGPKLPSGRRSKIRRLVSLSVCLKHDPWDTRFRPRNKKSLCLPGLIDSSDNPSGRCL